VSGLEFNDTRLALPEDLEPEMHEVSATDLADLNDPPWFLKDEAHGQRPFQLGSFVQALRPKQWVKNVLVFAAPLSGGLVLSGVAMAHAALTFVVFCAVASSVYLFNDVQDMAEDRLHPKKRMRPIARGDVSKKLALGASAVLGFAGLATAGLLIGVGLMGVLVAYMAISVAYCLKLKTVPVLELVAVASGFVLRTIGGAVSTDHSLSTWFLLATLGASLCIVLGKRHAEVLLLGSRKGAAHRAVLSAYSPRFIGSALIVSATLATLGYAVWILLQAGAGVPVAARICLVATLVPVAIGGFQLQRKISSGDGGSPEDLVFQDRILQVAGLLWSVLLVAGIYG
jgi:decaprenyl-phosphate phosphoribosyltransferase